MQKRIIKSKESQEENVIENYSEELVE